MGLRNNTTVRLIIGVALVVVVGLASGSYVYASFHNDRLLQAQRAIATAHASTIRIALEHQMLEKDRSLIRKLVRSFGADPSIKEVMLLDHTGHVVDSSFAEREGQTLSIDSPTCTTCHQRPPAERESSRLFDVGHTSILRSVTPIRNRPECYGCHAPTQRINGILIVDVDVTEMRSWAAIDARGLAIGGVALTLILIAGIAMMFRFAFVRRLRTFHETAHRIANGDIHSRLPVEGNDVLAWLAREFNTLADTTTGLVTGLAQEREQLDMVINGVDDGIVLLDQDLRILAANNAFIRRTGKKGKELADCSCTRQSGATSFCSTASCPARTLFRDGGRRRTVVLTGAGTDGEARHEEVHATSIRGSDGEPKYVVEIWRDITERRATEAKLAGSHRLASLGMVASGFSHELNTPLATILTCVEGMLRTLEQKVFGDDDRQYVEELARTAREQLLRCRGITQQFLRLARGTTANGGLVDLEALIPTMVRLIEPTAREAKVSVNTHLLGHSINVRANETDVQQVLLNLTLNAIQACAPGGTVEVSVEAAPVPRIFVRDDGKGMSPADQDRAFEPFFSLKRGGTGLGLFLSLQSAKTWRGDIKVSSVLGKGTTFEVLFPSPSSESQDDP